MSNLPTQRQPNVPQESPLSAPPPTTPSSVWADKDVVGELLAEALVLFERDRGAARRYIESAQRLIRAAVNEDRPKTCRLADWQVRRAKDFIRANLGSSLRIHAVAQLVHLSASYFSRSFKATTGVSYSDFVASARINLAKRLLLTTDAPISEVALICGLADQSHLTRLFNRVVGLPPDTWRRQVLGTARFPRRAKSPGRGYRHRRRGAAAFLANPEMVSQLRPQRPR